MKKQTLEALFRKYPIPKNNYTWKEDNLENFLKKDLKKHPDISDDIIRDIFDFYGKEYLREGNKRYLIDLKFLGMIDFKYIFLEPYFKLYDKFINKLGTIDNIRKHPHPEETIPEIVDRVFDSEFEKEFDNLMDFENEKGKQFLFEEYLDELNYFHSDSRRDMYRNMKNFNNIIGIFISYMFPGNEYELDIPDNLSKKVNCITLISKKHKKLIVNGDIGNDIGESLENGELIINGNVKNHLGFLMSGGKITVNGNAGACVGLGMSGGEIEVKKNIEGSFLKGNYIGWGMTGGKITVEGDIEYIDYGPKKEGYGSNIGYMMEGGEIYIKGDVYSNLGFNFFGKGIKGGKIVIDGNIYKRKHRGKMPRKYPLKKIKIPIGTKGEIWVSGKRIA